MGNLALLQQLTYRPLGKPVALWPCERQLVGNGAMREGPTLSALGFPVRPQKHLPSPPFELVEATGTPVHIMRVPPLAVSRIQDAKARGLPITVSTSWMHFYLTQKAVSNYDTESTSRTALGQPI